MAAQDYAKVVEQYKEYRRISREMNDILLKYFSKNAFLECGRDLGLAVGDTLVFEREDDTSVLMDYCIYNYYEDGRNAVARYIEERLPPPGTDEHNVLAAKSRSFHTLVQVTEVIEEVGVWVNDLLGNREFLIVDLGLSQTATEKLVIATRIVPFEDFTMTSGAPLVVSEKSLRNILTYLEDRFGSKDADYVEIDFDQRAELNAAIIRCCLQQDGESGPISYLDMEPASVSSHALTGSHIGRNAPCPCGSGRKYKKCCGRAS